MSRLPLERPDGGGRYPGFSTLAQADHWDRTTAAVVESRLGRPPDVRFFTPAEEAAGRALFDQLLAQRGEPRVPVVNMVDARLAEEQTDGWHYDNMPRDGEAWRATLAALDREAGSRAGCTFALLDPVEQAQLLQDVCDLHQELWHGLPADRVWSLWTRYACTAFYSHPLAWDEIGFAGPAYPRGYKNLGVDRLEPFEVRDVRPDADPARSSTRRAEQ
ncbi:gluconate 2-dehydrogenase subunit 3 family protein [Pseudarthrobacter sp. IC2-21]|uniref:gluconate 2-dehydrogenase subunit 3 family protein n=1 Tax=Pseudarthrobacter sp. IC2-21 TaxID=3092262 RepID=UPI002A6AA5EA|nr:gluconate 2-dehydrogenase subunit 3 family protein [Pseudarthrobacter sp. IC2-21]